MEDAVRSVYRGERCTYVLNSGHITQSAAAVFGVDFCASVAASTKKATEKTVRLTRIVMCDYHKDHPFFGCKLMTSINGCGESDIWLLIKPWRCKDVNISFRSAFRRRCLINMPASEKHFLVSLRKRKSAFSVTFPFAETISLTTKIQSTEFKSATARMVPLS